MKKFKVGDRVKHERFGEGTIVFDDGSTNIPFVVEFNKPNHYLHSGNGKGKQKHCYWCSTSDLELVSKPKQEVHIYTNDKITTAILKENGKVLKKSEAKCNPSDEFSFEAGAKLAFDRLFDKEPNTTVIKQTKYKVGDKVQIVSEWNKKTIGISKMNHWLGKVMTVKGIICDGHYSMEEDQKEVSEGWSWNEYCIEGKVVETEKRRAKKGEYVKVTSDDTSFEKDEIVRCIGNDEDEHDPFEYLDGYDYYYMDETDYVVLKNYQPEKIKVGDMVKVTDDGEQFDTYDIWFKETKNKGLRSHFIEGSDLDTKINYKVVAIGEHHSNKNITILAIQNPNTTQVFLIGEKGVEKI